MWSMVAVHRRCDLCELAASCGNRFQLICIFAGAQRPEMPLSSLSSSWMHTRPTMKQSNNLQQNSKHFPNGMKWFMRHAFLRARCRTPADDKWHSSREWNSFVREMASRFLPIYLWRMGRIFRQFIFSVRIPGRPTWIAISEETASTNHWSS